MIPQLDYAFYVWTSYALFALVMAWQFIQPRLRRQRIQAELREEQALINGGHHDTHA